MYARALDSQVVIRYACTLTLLTTTVIPTPPPNPSTLTSRSLLELAKLFNYVSNVRPWAQKITDALFTTFAVVFCLTRNLLFPLYLIRHCVVDLGTHVPDVLATRALIFFLCVLACLHVFWMSLIIKMAVRMAREGAATKDDRSDDESYLEQSIVCAKSTYNKEE